jgi:SAM-dependent methyltransferase
LTYPERDGVLALPPKTGFLLCMRFDGSPWVLETATRLVSSELSKLTLRSMPNVAEYFNDLYARHEDPWSYANVRRWLGNFAIADLILKDDVLRHASFLDIGCGRGDTVALLRDLGIRARGIDLSIGAINAGRRRWPEHADVLAQGRPEALTDIDPNSVLLLKDVDYYMAAEEAARLLAVVLGARLRVLVVRTGRSALMTSPAEDVLGKQLRMRILDHPVEGFSLRVMEYGL